MRKFVDFLTRVGDTKLPIGEPWFKLQFFAGVLPRLWPITWRGWLLVAGLLGWLAGSVLFFLAMHWQPSNYLLYGWLFPTLAGACLLVGIKTQSPAP
jgi:hypothetical protein